MHKQTNKQTVELTVNDPKSIEKSNCIPARYDCGISNYKTTGSGVIERS